MISINKENQRDDMRESRLWVCSVNYVHSLGKYLQFGKDFRVMVKHQPDEFS